MIPLNTLSTCECQLLKLRVHFCLRLGPADVRHTLITLRTLTPPTNLMSFMNFIRYSSLYAAGYLLYFVGLVRGARDATQSGPPQLSTPTPSGEEPSLQSELSAFLSQRGNHSLNVAVTARAPIESFCVHVRQKSLCVLL